MKSHFDTILFGKSSNSFSIGDMQQFLLGFCSNFVLGRYPIGKVRNDPNETPYKKMHDPSICFPNRKLCEGQISILLDERPGREKEAETMRLELRERKKITTPQLKRKEIL